MLSDHDSPYAIPNDPALAAVRSPTILLSDTAGARAATRQ